MGSFGNISEFNASVETWSQYTERLQQFFVANAITQEERKRAIFLTVIGPGTYALLRNLLSPAAPVDKSLNDLIKVLDEHFDPLPSEIIERFKFNTRVRSPGESVANFVAELRRLAKYCNFGNCLDEMLRDRIVCGIADETIQRKLLSENKLTLTRAMEIAIAMEAAARDALNLKQVTSEVNKIRLQRNSENTAKKNGKKNNNSVEKSCYCCGDSSHQIKQCKFRNSTCHSCGKMGHLSKVCRSKNRNKKNPKIHNLQTQEDTQIEHYTLYNIRDVGRVLPAAKVVCNVQGKPVIFEVDSGAPFTIMPENAFNKIRDSLPPLENTDIKLQSYTEHKIEILGVTQVEVTFKELSHCLPLIVVAQGTVNLAGRNWIYPLKLMSVFDKSSTEDFQKNLFNVSCAPSVNFSIKELLNDFKELFSPILGKVKGVEVYLKRKPGTTPKFFKARPVPYALREKVEEEILRLVKEDILEPVKSAESAAPIVPVLKPDGRIRICGDFKLTTNKDTELEQYPLPNIEDIFAQLSGGTSFSKLDLRDAYCQFQLEESSRDLVVINTHKGLFRYKRLPFGVASAPAIFQREMDKILQGIKGASCYLDDLLISGTDEVEHLHNLKAVLTRLQDAGMKLHPNKCEFLKPSVEYLGHRIDKNGLHPVDSKVKAIMEAPEPKNIEELRSFIGLVTYYAKFLPNMAVMLAPLYQLLRKKQKWIWGADQKNSFHKVKETLKNSSLLMHFDNSKEVILACDASPYGLGAVLSHNTPEGDRPIAFASRSLSKAERNYSHIEKETLALVFGVTKFRKYLLGRTFTLLTDHRPLVNLLSEDKPVPSVAAARIQRWALTLSAYSYKIKYRKGASHANADACSRLPLSIEHADSSVPAEFVLALQQLDDSPVTRHMIANEIEKCPDLKLLKLYILDGFPKNVELNMQSFLPVRHELAVEEGIILRGSRVFIPPKFRKFILDELHSAHQGISAIKSLARSYVWWPGIDKELELKVKQCAICQQNAAAPPANHVSWPIPEQVWDRIHIDHAGPFEDKMLLIIVDAKSKWLEVVPVPNTSSEITIKVLRGLFARFGIPKSLVSDNATGFTSVEFNKFLSMNGISHILIAPYHPNSNGIAERAVRTVKSALKKVSDGTIDQRIARFLLNFRNTPSNSTGVSPAVAMFGRPLRTRLSLLKDQMLSQKVGKKVSVSKFYVGEMVWARNFRSGPKWVRGKILALVGETMFKVQTSLGLWTRHADQIRPRKESNLPDIPLIDHPDPACAVSTESEKHTTQNANNEGTQTCNPKDFPMFSPGTSDLDNPPALSPQPSKPVVLQEHPPVLSPQTEIPVVQSKDSFPKTPRRSARIKKRKLCK